MGPPVRQFTLFVSLVVLIGCGCSGPHAHDHMDIAGWSFADSNGEWAAAEVPGCIHTDLMAHGVIPDPFLLRNEQEVQWVESRNWVYRCPLPKPPVVGDWALEFGGLDTYAEVEVNGRTVLSANNMHRTWRIAEADLSLTGKDTVVVRFLSPARMGQSVLDASPWPIPASNEARPIGRQTSAVTRKAMYHYGWDWGPRLATSGIWKPVRWVRTDTEWPTFRLVVASADSAQATCVVHWDQPVERITSRLTLAGSNVPHVLEQVDSVTHNLTIADPELWWPHGMGGQPLYDLELQGEGLRHSHSRFGVRTLEWRREADAFGQSMQCVVNGVPVQVRGANVIPPDFFPVRAEAGWNRVVKDAVGAHMNMVRVWGGAHYGDEALYDLCDERGLLVWQDFMNACAMVPGDSAWRTNFLVEAEEQILRLRNRTSLAIWAGNNETEKAWRDWGWQDLYDLHGADSVAVEAAYRKVFEDDLPALVARLGGGEYQPSSPHSLDPERPRESGDQHDWGVWFGKTGFDYYTDEAGRFASEFGLQSVPDRRTLEAAGVRSWSDSTLQFRQRCQMDWLEPGFDGWDMMRHYAGMYFADPESVDVARWGAGDLLDAWIYLSQLTQAEGLRQAIERHRCSGGRTAGSLYWQLDDVWPTVSWSTVDHTGRWKLAHYAVGHANRPVRLLPDRAARSWRAVNDGGSPAEGHLAWVHLSLDGDTLRQGALPVALGPFETEAFIPMPWPDREVLCIWNWSAGTGESFDQGAVLPARVGEVQWPNAGIQLTVEEQGVVLNSSRPAAGVWLRSDRAGRFEDNGFMLAPGQPRRIRFLDEEGRPADPGEVRLTDYAALQRAVRPSI